MKRRLFTTLILLLAAGLLTPLAQAAPDEPAAGFKARALEKYTLIVQRQAEFQRYQTMLPADFQLGQGALLAYLENGEVLGIIVKYSGARAGDWQEFYFQEGKPFFIFSKFNNPQDNRLYRNRFFLKDGSEPQGWEVNDMAQTVRGEAADLAFSRILEDARLYSELVKRNMDEQAKAAEAAAAAAANPSIVEALAKPENAPETGAAASPTATTPEGQPAEAAAKPVRQEDDPVNPELARWAAWANATRENKEPITPFPAELVLGKIEVPPLPDKPAPAPQEEIKPETHLPADAPQPDPASAPGAN